MKKVGLLTEKQPRDLSDAVQKSRELTSLRSLRNCVKVELAVLGSPSLISLMVSVDVSSNP